MLSKNGCTKKECAVAAAPKRAGENQQSLVPGVPLQRESEVLPCLPMPQEVCLGRKRPRPDKGSRAGISTRPELRQVRVVHGEDENMKAKIWMYIPEHRGDRTGTIRKGWWLHPEPNKPRLYYIGSLEFVQATKKAK